MNYELKIRLEDSYVQVISNGDKSYKTACNLWSEIMAFCKKHNCYKILGIANSTKAFSATEAFDHEKLFRNLGIDSSYRIAWVEQNLEAKKTIVFIETVLKNRGLPGRVFSNVSEAKEWLLKFD